tara:strand:+ start:1249 stop:4104 length:2856 start_codon:yes stop_codon:yes gene_type:complete
MAQDAGDGTGRQHNEPTRTTKVNVEKKPPQIINEYIGDVFGNILDRYDLPTYNLKLYMIGPGSKNTSAGNPAGVTQDSDVSDGNDARETVANKKGTLYTTGDGYLNNSVTAPPENTVVLAQTGVTEVGIDELEIVTVPGAIGGGVEGSQVNFTITQPNAADFPDQIVKARTYLGAPADAIDCPFFLEITFRGRKESNENMDDWDMDKGGELADISGPFVYTLLLKNFSMSIDQSGSTYQFQTVMKNDTYTADTFFRTRKFYTISGRTIGMLLKDLETQTNEYNEKEDIIDRISFGLDALGEKDFSKEGSDKVLESRDDYFVPNFDITDQSLDIDNAETIAKITKLEVTEAKDTEEAAEESEETPDKAKSSAINKNPETNNITLDLKEGITMDRVLGIILSMNKEFMQKASRSKDIEDPENEEVEPTKEPIWYDFRGSVEYVDFDNKEKVYAKLAHIIPVTRKSNKTDIAITPSEVDKNNNLTKEESKQRVNQMKIKKAYEYIFTGRNDQIINVNLDYREGMALLLPPDRGMLGDISLNAQSILNPSPKAKTESLKDNGVDKLVEEAEKDGKSGSFFDQLKKLKDDVEKGESFLKELGNAANFTGSQIKDLITNTNGSTAQQLEDLLSNQATAQAVADKLTENKKNSPQSNVTTETDTISSTTTDFVYGGDLIGDTKYAQQLSDGSKKAHYSPSSKDDKKEEETDNTGIAQRKEYHNKTGFANVGTTKTIKNNLFTYLYDQHQAIDFLMKLDLELRGDPYWLGKEMLLNPIQQTGLDAKKTEDDDADADNYAVSSRENFLMFSINSPRLFDPDTENEDNNTGLWIKEGDGTSYFISGIYQVRSVTHNFKMGVYTMDMTAIKETAISLKNIDRTKSQFSYVDENRRGFSAMEQDGYKRDEDGNLFERPEWAYVQGLLDNGNQGKTLDELIENNAISSEQKDAYLSYIKERDNG